MTSKKPAKTVLEWDDLTAHQRMIVREGRKPGTPIPTTIRTAEQYVVWMEMRMLNATAGK